MEYVFYNQEFFSGFLHNQSHQLTHSLIPVGINQQYMNGKKYWINKEHLPNKTKFLGKVQSEILSR